MNAPGLIVIGGYINGLGLVRALAVRGIPTAVIRTKAYDIAHLSRWIVSYDTALDLHERTESLLELLERRSLEWDGWALLPSNDEALAALAQHYETLSRRHTVMASPMEVTKYFLDKDKMLALAQAVGVPVPRCYDGSETDMRFPVLVKPVRGYQFVPRFGCKLLVARDRVELNDCLSRVAAAKMLCQVHDYVEGPDSNIYVYCVYVDAKGKPGQGLTLRKLRQSPPFYGVARVAEVTRHIPQLREATVEMLRRVGFRGIAEAEFKLDARDGTFRFLEINGRSLLANSLLRRAGMDLAWMSWCDFVEGRSEPPRLNGWPGVWVNLHADLAYSTVYRHLDPISWREFLAPYRRPMIEAVWSWRDPLPFAGQWIRLRGTCSPNRVSTPSDAPSQ